MELNQLHQQVDEKLFKLDNEIERFKINIAASDEPEQRELLERDLATLQVIREKLIKAKSITQQVTDLRADVEKPRSPFADIPKWFIFSLLAILAGAMALGVMIF